MLNLKIMAVLRPLDSFNHYFLCVPYFLAPFPRKLAYLRPAPHS